MYMYRYMYISSSLSLYSHHWKTLEDMWETNFSPISSVEDVDSIKGIKKV